MERVRWAGWIDKKHLAWMKKKAASQEVPTSPAGVLRLALDKAMKTDKKKRRSE